MPAPFVRSVLLQLLHYTSTDVYGPTSLTCNTYRLCSFDQSWAARFVVERW